MSITRTGKFCGPENHFYGKHHTEETKKRLSEIKKKIVIDDEWRRKLKESHHTVKVINLDTKEVFNSIKEAGEKFNIEPTHISRVCRGKRKTANGYRWGYYEN